ncbi:MAG: site-specific integrase [Saprospiraceae bacterium]|nr:site-specific integrase [Saprospiraceae bacterium]
MSTSSGFGIHFVIRERSYRPGYGSVAMRIVAQVKRIEISMNTVVLLEDWDKTKGRAKDRNPEARSINKFLDQSKAKMWGLYKDSRIYEETLDLNALKDAFLGVEVKQKTILEAFTYHYRLQSSVLKPGTLKNYRTTEKYIKEFVTKEKRKTDIPLVKINYQFITEFEYFLRMYIPKDHRKKLQNNGLMKHMERLQKVLNFVHKLDWMTEKPMEKFSLKFVKTDRGYLSEEELELLENIQLDSIRLDKTRDLFIFSCYTGLSYIDMYLLSTDHITRGIDGNFWIQTQREKSSEKVIVPLLPKALELIKKYSNDPSAIRQGSVFPPISNQKINSYLKELATICGIQQRLTFHLARHTFATTVTLSNGVPIETVSKMLGHTRISTTQIYAKVVERKVSEDMAALRNRLEGQRRNIKIRTGTNH